MAMFDPLARLPAGEAHGMGLADSDSEDVVFNQATGHLIDPSMVKTAIRLLLVALGEDIESERLRDTPARVARAYIEQLGGQPSWTATTFEPARANQLVAVTGVRVWSLCEHHLLPFYCDLSIGYVCNRRMIGLSKLARIAHRHAHELQVQERLVADIADHVREVAETDDVAVIGSGMHLCAVMRGVKAEGMLMITSNLNGCFLTEDAARQEFFNIVNRTPARTL